jgi:hypothetical protein
MNKLFLPAMLFAGVLSGAIGCGEGGCGQPSNKELLDEIKRQEDEIKKLNDKLDRHASDARGSNSGTDSGAGAGGSAGRPTEPVKP